ncbi:Asparagine synthetase [Lutibaculum baratangense AMV1]|uniref:asparagine synthase (glutamine-hydrolyzing) n=1 Tax=Lutibaculum baratangense AMV1 TaxID=631454 RepID=V4QTI6_9HYPH|nr:Asparagine synthetase [Lutibaculum baratangense AMV1]
MLHRMTRALWHRGPDGEGHEILPLTDVDSAGLGHRRLAIIDLSTGAQPMKSHDGRFVITFNGEIYNYLELRRELLDLGARFTTRSDTEVIMEAWRQWGAAGLARLRGMFAFALYDEAERMVVLARDPFGKKPLFVHELPGASGGTQLVFASEIAALLTHPGIRAEIDPASIHDYLCWRYVPSPHTFFRGVRKLMPGGMLVWRDGRIKESRYWLPPEERATPQSVATADIVGNFLEVFDEAVRIRLRADVPVGAFLSGGLDSAAIVATLAHLGVSSIRTFSVGFRGDPSSELAAAEDSARHFGSIHTPVEFGIEALSLLPKLSAHRGAPIAEPADLPIHLMSLEAARHVKVVLSGEGSDEMFGGYPKHLAEMHLGRVRPRGLVSVGSRALLAATSALPGRSRRVGIAARAMAESDFEQRMVRWFGALTPSERQRVWKHGAPQRPVWTVPFRCAPNASPLRRVLHFDQTSWLPDNLLERMDMMTMAASIEARAPFMDTRLAEFASTLPDSWRIRGRTTKRIVRVALAHRLPHGALERPKNGFRLPVGAWFRGPLRDAFSDTLLGQDAVSRDYLDQAVLRAILSEHRDGRRDHDKTLWSLFALETFLRAFSGGRDARVDDQPSRVAIAC